MLSYLITGNPYVKKSNQRVVLRNNRSIKIDTPSYKQWRRDALWQLSALKKPSEPIDFPVNLKCIFYKKTHGAVDLSALYEGIQDVLVEVGVLADDNFRIVAGHDGSRCFVDPDNPRMEITITPMDPADFGKARSIKKQPKSEEEIF